MLVLCSPCFLHLYVEGNGPLEVYLVLEGCESLVMLGMSLLVRYMYTFLARRDGPQLWTADVLALFGQDPVSFRQVQAVLEPSCSFGTCFPTDRAPARLGACFLRL